MSKIVSVRPLYLQIGQQLRTDIFSGKVPPGARLGTEAVLMERFNVSRSTIRKALAGLVSEGLVRRVPGGGTFIRHRRKRTAVTRPRCNHVAIQCIDLQTTLTDTAKELVRGAATALESFGMTAGVFLYDPNDDRAQSNLIFQQAVLDNRVDGVISTQHLGRRRYLQLQEAGVPLVLTFFWDGMDLPTVCLDTFERFHGLTAAALDAGWRTPALVKGPGAWRAEELAFADDHLVGLRAAEGYRQALVAHGRPFYPSHILCSNYRPEDAEQVAALVRQLDPPPDVLIVDGAEVGAALWEALEKHIPIVSQGPRQNYSEICVVRAPHFEIGRKAGEMLKERIEHPEAPVRQELLKSDWGQARAEVLAFRQKWLTDNVSAAATQRD